MPSDYHICPSSTPDLFCRSSYLEHRTTSKFAPRRIPSVFHSFVSRNSIVSIFSDLFRPFEKVNVLIFNSNVVVSHRHGDRKCGCVIDTPRIRARNHALQGRSNFHPSLLNTGCDLLQDRPSACHIKNFRAGRGLALERRIFDSGCFALKSAAGRLLAAPRPILLRRNKVSEPKSYYQ